MTGRHNLRAGGNGGKRRADCGRRLPSASHSMTEKLLLIFCRADSTHLAEHTRKVLLRFEATSHCDIKTRASAARNISLARSTL